MVLITGLPQSQESQENQEKSGKTKKEEDKSQEKSVENGGFRKKVRKFDINMLLIRKFIITKKCILLMLFSKNFAFAIHLFFQDLIEFLE